VSAVEKATVFHDGRDHEAGAVRCAGTRSASVSCTSSMGPRKLPALQASQSGMTIAKHSVRLIAIHGIPHSFSYPHEYWSSLLANDADAICIVLTMQNSLPKM
jgi:hypothetical protein